MTTLGKIQKLKSKMNELLNNYRTAKGQTEFTHVSLGGAALPGKYNIDKKGQNSLIKLLNKAIKYKLTYSIAEIPQEFGPIKVDVDLNFPADDFEEGRLYDSDTIINVLTIYRDVIKKYVNCIDSELICYVFEKEIYQVKNSEIKDGFHLIFPNLNLDKKIRHLIINDVIDTVHEKELFNHLSNPNVIDKQIVSSNAWMMYGCAKPNCSPYLLKKILDVNNNELDNENEDIIKFLSLRNKKWNSDNSSKLQENINEEFIQQNFNSLNISNSPNTHLDNIIPEDKLEDIEKANKLVDMLNSKRAHGYNTWIRVGWALHNIDKSLLDKWIEFSKRSKKFKNGECDTMWKAMRDEGYTIRTLMLWAKEDSPTEYDIFCKELFNNILKKNAPNNTFGVAEALHFEYFDRFVCVNVKDNLWYEFRDHKWKQCPDGGSLIMLMSRHFSNKYISEANKYNNLAINAQGGDKKRFLDESTTYAKIAAGLMDINFKGRILKEAKYIFYDSKFLQRLDENHQLIGFENGVYDLDMKLFRDGQADDHISLSTGVDYIKWSDNNPYAKKINGFFEKVLTNKNVREYFLSRLSSCVSGKCEEKFYFCTGSGSNGKSLTFQLLAEALGDYYISCPITIITRKRGAASAASPELARLKGPRAGVFQEPGTEEELNVGIFKELSGNDRFMVRGLYKEPIEVKPQVKYWLTCNDLPKVTSDDGGTWRRIRVIDFASKFVDDPDPENPNHFKIDMSLKEQITKWAPYFASYLVDRYIKEYNTESKISEPQEVMVSTNKYRQEQDTLREFYDTNIEDSEDDTIKKRDLYTNFKMWFKDVHDGEVLPKSKKLYEFMEKTLKKEYKRDGYVGIRFKSNSLDSDDGENDLDI